MSAKQQRSIKQTAIQRPGQVGSQHELTEVFDDNLLPDAAEIEKLQRMDPEIFKWLKDRAAAEQEFRHTAYSRRLTLADADGKRCHHLNILGMILAFFLMVVSFGFSAYLIYQKQVLTGTVFSGATMLLIAITFIKRKIPKKVPPTS